MPTEEGSWVVLELSPQGERLASGGDLRGVLQSLLGSEWDDDLFFIPYTPVKSSNSQFVLNVIEGYIFVSSSLIEECLSAVVGSPFISGTIPYSSGGYGTVADSSVESLKEKLGEMVSTQLSEGQKVKVSGGPLSGLEGVVILKGDRHSHVKVCLRSLEAVRVFENYILEPV